MNFNYKNVMAGQFNGPVIASLLQGMHLPFEASKNQLQHRLTLSISSATTEELDLIGKFMSIPRPYAEIDGELVLANDELYRLILVNTAVLRKTKSIRDLGEMLEYVLKNGAYLIEVQSNGDIKLTVDSSYDAYIPYFAQVLNSIYNTLPKISPIETRPLSNFIYNHILYTRLLRLRDSQWILTINAEEHKGYISAPAEKCYIENHVLHQITN